MGLFLRQLPITKISNEFDELFKILYRKKKTLIENLQEEMNTILSDLNETRSKTFTLDHVVIEPQYTQPFKDIVDKMFPNRKVKVDLNIHIDPATGNLNLPLLHCQPDFDKFESMIDTSPITNKNILRAAYQRFALKDCELSTVNELQLSEIMHMPQSENPSPVKAKNEIPQFKIDLDQINKLKNTSSTKQVSPKVSKLKGDKDTAVGRASLNSQLSQKSTTGGQKSKSKRAELNTIARTSSNIYTNRDTVNMEPVIETQSVIKKPIKTVADVKSFTYFVKSSTAANMSNSRNEKGSSEEKPPGFRSSFEGQTTPSSKSKVSKGRGLKLNLAKTSIDYGI